MTIGISKELIERLITSRAFKEQDKVILKVLLERCKELNPWQPIETAPKDRRVLVYVPGIGQLTSKNAGKSFGATLWQELPEDPK